MTNKYRARTTVVEGYTFQSLIEAKRYRELRLMQRAGEIELLEVHPRFKVFDGFKCGIELVRPIHYTADFRYWDNKAGRMIVEDVKAFDKRTGKYLITEASNMRIKLFKFRYWNDYEFRIVG